MKTRAFILTTGLLLVCFSSFSQVKAEEKTSSPATGSTATKGYYAISNNSEKQNSQSSGVQIKASRETFPTVKKGYYSIGNNNEKLRKQITIRVSSTDSLRPAKKGYYSIGTNNDKPLE